MYVDDIFIICEGSTATAQDTLHDYNLHNQVQTVTGKQPQNTFPRPENLQAK